MNEPNTPVLSAWSNGCWIQLDLERNLYLASELETAPGLKVAQVAASVKLRDCPRAPPDFIPPGEMVRHYLRSAWWAWRNRYEPLRQQLRLLRSKAAKGRPRFSSVLDAERCATLYQHMRNLRFQRPACLEDSIGCALFLRRYVAPITFHIGVLQPPFRAHAWVQSGELIVNDTKAAVEDYSEILRFEP